MFNGLSVRIIKEIKALAPLKMKDEVYVIVNPERKFSSWIGGSILTLISTFGSMCI